MNNLYKSAALLIFLTILFACEKKNEKPKEPEAAFEWQLLNEPGKVKFTNQSKNADIYEWNFDDGTFSTMVHPVKIYQQNGNYVVTLKAYGYGKSHSVKDTVIVNNIP